MAMCGVYDKRRLMSSCLRVVCPAESITETNLSLLLPPLPQGEGWGEGIKQACPTTGPGLHDPAQTNHHPATGPACLAEN